MRGWKTETKIQRDERDQIQKNGEAERIHLVHQEISSIKKQKATSTSKSQA